MFFNRALSIVKFTKASAIFGVGMKDEYYRFAVRGVSLERATGRCRLLLDSREVGDTLSIDVAPHKAGEIILRANGMEADPDDLLDLFFRAHSFRPMYVQIGGPEIDHRHAQLHYRERARRYQLDLSAEQAVPFAARMGVPVFVHSRAVAPWALQPGVSTARHEVLPVPASA
ncbi:MAG: hypothetical protein EA403_11905 [Spirochaetaceae bacterium]|nr:MAG: hypothetical protein EA403_11905 [Spirochaetaceae bacterium]